MMASIMRKPELMMFTDATTLESLMSPEDKAVVAAALDARGIPAGSVAKMKPWMLSAMLALPACELARKAEGAPVLDVKLAEDAKAHGKKLEGWRPSSSQLRGHGLPADDPHEGPRRHAEARRPDGRRDRDDDRSLHARATPARSGRCSAPSCRAARTMPPTMPPSSRPW